MKDYDLSGNFCLKIAKNNPRDRIEVEIGDSKQPTKFYPQVKIMRWGNEVNCSFRLLDDEPKTLTTEGEKIKLIGAKKEVHLYDIAPCEEHPEGGYEFEVILKEKPASNVLEFSLVDKDVEYFYQPPLAQKEIDKGAVRPENVVGSYAVYAKSNKVNYVGGKEYKCGKVGHIYHPKIIDSAGKEVWGELHIENGILSVTIPQDFLDKAVYPVRHAAGFTFGYNTIGGSNNNFSFLLTSGVTYLGATGTGSSMSIYGKRAFGFDANVQMAVYNNTSLVSNSNTPSVLINSDTAQWWTSNYSTAPHSLLVIII